MYACKLPCRRPYALRYFLHAPINCCNVDVTKTCKVLIIALFLLKIILGLKKVVNNTTPKVSYRPIKILAFRIKMYMSVAMLEIGGPCDWSIRAKIVTVSRLVARNFPFSLAFRSESY